MELATSKQAAAERELREERSKVSAAARDKKNLTAHVSELETKLIQEHDKSARRVVRVAASILAPRRHDDDDDNKSIVTRDSVESHTREAIDRFVDAAAAHSLDPVYEHLTARCGHLEAYVVDLEQRLHEEHEKAAARVVRIAASILHPRRPPALTAGAAGSPGGEDPSSFTALVVAGHGGGGGSGGGGEDDDDGGSEDSADSVELHTREAVQRIVAAAAGTDPIYENLSATAAHLEHEKRTLALQLGQLEHRLADERANSASLGEALFAASQRVAKLEARGGNTRLAREREVAEAAAAQAQTNAAAAAAATTAARGSAVYARPAAGAPPSRQPLLAEDRNLRGRRDGALRGARVRSPVVVGAQAPRKSTVSPVTEEGGGYGQQAQQQQVQQVQMQPPPRGARDGSRDRAVPAAIADGAEVNGQRRPRVRPRGGGGDDGCAGLSNPSTARSFHDDFYAASTSAQDPADTAGTQLGDGEEAVAPLNAFLPSKACSAPPSPHSLHSQLAFLAEEAPSSAMSPTGSHAAAAPAASVTAVAKVAGQQQRRRDDRTPAARPRSAVRLAKLDQVHAIEELQGGDGSDGGDDGDGGDGASLGFEDARQAPQRQRLQLQPLQPQFQPQPQPRAPGFGQRASAPRAVAPPRFARVRDYSVLVDASASMRLVDRGAFGRSRWTMARDALELLVPQVCPLLNAPRPRAAAAGSASALHNPPPPALSPKLSIQL